MMAKRIFPLLFTVAAILGMEGISTAAPQVVGKTVEYTVDGLKMKSYFAYDEKTQGQQPAVLVVPEWWGVTDYTRRRARMVAGLGYAALVVDMYGEGKEAKTPAEAGQASSAVMNHFDIDRARFLAAMKFLQEKANVDPKRIAAIGYCFGGGVVLNMARQGVELQGVVSFHGDLTAVKPAQPGTIKTKILVLAGGDDQLVPPEKVEAFRKEMKTAGADFRIVSSPGAKHSFTNPDATALGKKFKLPIAYNAQADQKSWEEMKEFLKGLFKP
jgi:dienelactone hydrolase